MKRHNALRLSALAVLGLVMAPGAYFMLEHTVRTLFGSSS